MDALEKKQAYYEYGPSGWRYHQPPALPPDVAALMETFGRDEHGDPLWRFLWGGCALVRTDPENPDATILGDPAATKRVEGRLVCRHLAGKKARPVAWLYRGAKGGTIRVGRSDLVPEGVPTWVEVEYADYGRLRWFLERKLTAAQAVAAGVTDERDVRPEGDYVALLTVETDDGDYFEPDVRFVRMVEEYLREEINERPVDLLRKWREKRRRDAEAADASEADSRAGLTEDLTIAAEKRAARGEVKQFSRGRVTPAAPRPPQPFPGDITTV